MSIETGPIELSGENILSRFIALNSIPAAPAPLTSSADLKETEPKESVNKETSSLNTKKVVYPPDFLISLKDSPLIPTAEELNLASNQFWLEHLKDKVNTTGHNKKDWGSNNERNTRNKKNNNNNNPQKKKGGKNKHGEDETPDWMLENDEPRGNTLLDFEKWKLKMKIEGLRRKNEPVPEEDLKKYEALVNQSGAATQSPEVQKSEVQSSVQPTASTLSFAKSSPQIDAFGTLSGTSTTGAVTGTSSRFSSFFHTEEKKETTPSNNNSPAIAPATTTSSIPSNINNDPNAIRNTPLAFPPGVNPLANPLADLFSEAKLAAGSPLQNTNSPRPATSLPPGLAPPVPMANNSAATATPQSNDMFLQQLLNRSNAPQPQPQPQHQPQQLQQQPQPQQPQQPQQQSNVQRSPHQYQQYQPRPQQPQQPQQGRQQQPQQQRPNQKNNNNEKQNAKMSSEEQAAAFLKDLQKMPGQFFPPGMMNGPPGIGPNGMPLPQFMPPMGMNFPPPPGMNGMPLPPMNMGNFPPPPNGQLPNPMFQGMPLGFPPNGPFPPHMQPPQQNQQNQQNQQSQPQQGQAMSANALFEAVRQQQNMAQKK